MNETQSVSIVIPTLRESNNISRLVKSLTPIQQSCKKFELLLIDDNSQDGTEEIVKELQPTYPWLHLFIRKEAPRDLSMSVLKGLALAQQDIIIVMDGDLSHPSNKILDMINALNNTNTDFVMGSRFLKNASISHRWPWYRNINARVAKWLAKPLTHVSDPLSGFFGLHQSLFEQCKDQLNPIGYKIGLELMIKSNAKNIKEIGIHFEDRQFGSSKMTMKQQWNYLRHLCRLYYFKWKHS